MSKTEEQRAKAMEAIRRYRDLHPDRVLAANEKQRNKPEYRAKHRLANQKWRANNPDKVKASKAKEKEVHPEKHLARRELNHAVERGRIARPAECSECGTSGPIEAHHEDYAKSLEVVWLCHSCHRQADNIRQKRMDSNERPSRIF